MKVLHVINRLAVGGTGAHLLIPCDVEYQRLESIGICGREEFPSS